MNEVRILILGEKIWQNIIFRLRVCMGGVVWSWSQ